MEVTNKFRVLDLVYRVPEKLWAEVHDILQEAVIKTIPKEKKCKKAKWLSEEALQIAEKRREVKAKEKRKDRDIKGIFHAKMGTIKDRNVMDLTEAEDIEKR